MSIKSSQLPPLAHHHDRRDGENNHQCNIRFHRKHTLLALNLLSDGNFAKMGGVCRNAMNIKSELQTTKMLTLSETTNMQASVLAGKIQGSSFKY